MDKIFQMPFDESDGANKAYDYSSNRADGDVIGAHFVSGKNGNAISFDGESTCEVSKNVLNIAQNEWTIMAWVRNTIIETGTAQRLIWVLNFDGVENYRTCTMEVTPGSWCSVAITKRGSQYTIYLNSNVVDTIVAPGTLVGVSLNQDFYGGEYAMACLDDVVMFGQCLTQTEIIDELAATKSQSYLIDGVDFKDYGVYVSGSKGILNRPKMRTPASVVWDNYHGTSVDLQHKFLENREITLQCFIKAANKNDFISRVAAFEELFNKRGTNRLVIDVHPIKPLIYEVYCADTIDVEKTWNDNLMVGTFNLKLIEPEPVKRILKHMRNSSATATCTIAMNTGKKYVNVYWGDGSVDYDVYLEGGDKAISHTYAENGDYFPVITGDIDRITDFETNAIVVWNKL